MNLTPKFFNDRDLNYYCESFENLHPNKSKGRGIAPHKPILLLAVIDLIGQGFFQDNKIFVGEALAENFEQYWQSIPSHYTQNFKSDFFYPFRYLANEGFWHLKLRDNRDLKGFKPKSYSQLTTTVEYASFDENLFQFLQNPESRQLLIDTLISTWFSMTQQSDGKIVELNTYLQTAIKKRLEAKSVLPSEPPSFSLRLSPVRNAFFSKAIVYVYDYRCALCQLRVTKKLNQNIVEGAHIIPFALQYNNNINNGISFCRNHHWAFDNGLFSIDRKYKIMINKTIFEEDSPYSTPLEAFHGNPLYLPHNKEFIPSPSALEWHRNRWSYKAS